MIDAYFRITLLFLRFGGIPIKMQTVSIVNRIYIEIMTVCYYITFLSIIMNFVLKNEDKPESMKNIPMIFAWAFVSWMHLYLR
jgi:hypothetical protein